MRILLVAEDAVRAARITRSLEERGHDVFHAASIADGMEALEMQKFELVLRNRTPETPKNPAAVDRFHEFFRNDDRPKLVILVEDDDSAELFHWSQPAVEGVDAVVRGRFSSSRIAELVDDLVNQPRLRPSMAAPVSSDDMPVFERGQFERQMNYDRRLMAEIINLFVNETNQQIAELQSAIDNGLSAQSKRLAHTLKGSFGAVYALQAGAIAREIEQAATYDPTSARRIMPRLVQATADIQKRLLGLIANEISPPEGS